MCPTSIESYATSNEKELHQAILESLEEAIVTTRFDGEVTYLNTAAKRLFGTSSNAAVGEPLAKILALRDGATRAPVAAPLTRVIANAETREVGEFDFLVRRDGTEVPIEVNCSLLRHAESGEAIGLLLTLRDARRWWDVVRRATHDPLTRLVNREEFERRLESLLGRRRGGEPHALMYLDLNRFKRINDTHGHAAGDSVLRQVGAIFEAAVRGRDTLARIGGDEFALLMPNCPLERARAHAETLRRQLRAQPLHWQGHAFQLDVAIGVVPIAAEDRDALAVMAAADRACYAAKHDYYSDWALPRVASIHSAARTYL